MTSGYEKHKHYGGPNPSWREALIFIAIVLLGIYLWYS